MKKKIGSIRHFWSVFVVLALLALLSPAVIIGSFVTMPIRPALADPATTQVIVGGYSAASGAGMTNAYFNCVQGGFTWNATETTRYQIMPTAGTFSKLYVKLSASPGSSKSWTITFRLNGASQSLAATVSESDTTANDTTHSVSVVAGDLIDIQCTASNSPAAASAIWSFQFLGSTADETLCLGTMGTPNTSSASYMPLQNHDQSYAGLISNEAYTREPWPSDGTLKKMYVWLSASPGSSKYWTFYLRLQGSNSALTVDITGSATTGNDTSHTDVISIVGNASPYTLINASITPSSLPAACYYSISFVFVPSSPGESVILSGQNGTVIAQASLYAMLSRGAYNTAWDATEANTVQLIQRCTLEKLCVLDARYVGGNTWTVAVRVAGSTTGLTATTRPTGGAGWDLTDGAACANGDSVSLYCSAKANTPYLSWGMVVNTMPRVTGVTPCNGLRGESVEPKILVGFTFTGATVVSFGAGITVNTFNVDSDTQITAYVTIAFDAAYGLRSVSVTSSWGTGTLNNAFNVYSQAQIIIGGASTVNLSSGNSLPICGGDNYSNYLTGQVMPTAGILSNLEIRLSVAPGAGKWWEFYIVDPYQPNVGKIIDIIISGSNTTGSDTSHIMVEAAGYRPYITASGVGSPAATKATWSTQFVGTITNETICLSGLTLGNSATNYVSIENGLASSGTTTESMVQIPCPLSGTFKNLYVEQEGASGASKSYAYTFRKNTADTTLTCTVSGASAVTANDTTHTVSVAAGDLLDVKIVPTNTPTITITRISTVFVPSTSCLWSIVCSPMISDPSSNNYRAPVSDSVSLLWTSEETSYQLTQLGQCSNLYVRDVTGDSAAGTITLRNGGSSTALSVAISPGAVSSNTTDIAYVADASTIDYLATSVSNAPKITYAFTIAQLVPAAGAGSQVLMAGAQGTVNSGATRYNNIIGGGSWDATEANVNQVVSSSGTLSSLYVSLDASPGGGVKTYTFTVMVNGVASPMVVPIVGDATSNHDTVHSIGVSPGKLIDIKCVPTNSPSNTPAAKWSVVFTPATVGETVTLGTSSSNTGSTYYGPVIGNYKQTTSATESDWEIPWPTGGTLKNLRVWGDANPGGTTKTYTITLRDNESDTSLTCAVVGTATTGSDTTHTVSVTAGHRYTFSVVPSNTPSNAPNYSIGMTFVPTTVGQAVEGGCQAAAVGVSGDSYNGVLASGTAWNATETTVSQLGQLCVISNLYVYEVSGAGSGTFYLNQNASPTALTVSITTSGVVSDTTHTVSVANADTLDVHVNTTVGLKLKWSMVATIVDSPVVAVQSTSPIGMTTATLNGNITSVGGVNCDYRGFVWDASTHGVPGNVAPASSGYASNWTDSGSFGTGVYSHGITDLTSGYTYYVRACCHNSWGWTYSSSEDSFITLTLSFTVSPSTYGWGIVGASETPVTGLDYFTITNTGGVAVDITIHGHDMTGSGTTWTLSDTATPGDGICGYLAGLEGGSYTIIVKKNTTYNTLKSDLAASGTQKFGLELLTPTVNMGPGVQVTGTITLTATQH